MEHVHQQCLDPHSLCALVKEVLDARKRLALETDSIRQRSPWLHLPQPTYKDKFDGTDGMNFCDFVFYFLLSKHEKASLARKVFLEILVEVHKLPQKLHGYSYHWFLRLCGYRPAQELPPLIFAPGAVHTVWASIHAGIIRMQQTETSFKGDIYEAISEASPAVTSTQPPPQDATVENKLEYTQNMLSSVQPKSNNASSGFYPKKNLLPGNMILSNSDLAEGESQISAHPPPRTKSTAHWRECLLKIFALLAPTFYWGFWPDLLFEPASTLPEVIPVDMFYAGLGIARVLRDIVRPSEYREDQAISFMDLVIAALKNPHPLENQEVRAEQAASSRLWMPNPKTVFDLMLVAWITQRTLLAEVLDCAFRLVNISHQGKYSCEDFIFIAKMLSSEPQPSKFILARFYMTIDKHSETGVSADIFTGALLSAIDGGLIRLAYGQIDPQRPHRISTHDILQGTLGPVVAYSWNRLLLPNKIEQMGRLQTYVEQIKEKQRIELDQGADLLTTQKTAAEMHIFDTLDLTALSTAIRYCKQLARQMELSMKNKDVRISMKVLMELARVTVQYQPWYKHIANSSPLIPLVTAS